MKTFGPYTLNRTLGSGAMGEVFEATHNTTGETVALKRLFPHVMAHEVTVTRFVREFRAASRIKHPHILRMYDVGRVEKMPYFTMELINGETLRKFVSRGGLGSPPLPRLMRLLAQVADALRTLHVTGIAHRDVKPDNVLIRGADDAVLCDFGLARGEDDDALTQKGELLGTFRYLAPEVIQGETADHRADAYALGVMAFEMCVGEPPFKGEDTAVLMAHVEEPAPDIRTRVSGAPEKLATLLLGLMHKNPGERTTVARAASVLGALAGYTAQSATNRGAGSLSNAFVGRVEELQRLARIVEVGNETSAPPIAVISGQSGMGKTRLLTEFGKRALRAGYVALHSGAGGDGVNLPYQLWRQPMNAISRRLKLGEPDFDGQHEGGGAEHRSRVWRDVRELMKAASKQKRLVLLMDNADEADELSHFLIRRLQGGDAVGLNVLLVATARQPKIITEQVMDPRGCTELPLSPLSKQHVQELFRAGTDSAVEDVMERTDISGGVPARVVEAAVAYADGESTEFDRGRKVVDVTERNPVIVDKSPPVRVRVTPQLELAPADALEWTLAVLGSRTPIRTIVRLFGIAAESAEASMVLDGLQQLLARQVVVEDAAGRIDFLTAARRQQSYAAAPADVRTQLHRRVAEALSARADGSGAAAEVVAYHLLRSGNAEQAVDQLAQAAEAAVAVWAPEKALSLVARGIEALASRAGKDASTVFAKAASVDAARAAAMCLIRLSVLQAKGGAAAYWAAALESRDVVDAQKHPGLSSDLQAHVAEAALHVGRLPDALKHAQRGLELSRKSRDPQREADRALLLFRVRDAGSQEATRHDLALALVLARRSRDVTRVVRALIQAATLHLRGGRARIALRPARRAVRLAEKRKMRVEGLWARRVMAGCLLDLDARNKAGRELIAHVADAEAGGFLQETAEGLLELARYHRNILELKAARTAAQKATSLAQEAELKTVLLGAHAMQLQVETLSALKEGTMREFLREDVQGLVEKVRELSLPGADPWVAVDLWFHEALPRVVAREERTAKQLDLMLRAASKDQPKRWFERKAFVLVLAESLRLGGDVDGAREYATRVLNDMELRGSDEMRRLANQILSKLPAAAEKRA